MTLKFYLVLCGLMGVIASINISYQDIALGVCVRKILQEITKFQNFTADVSLINNDNIMIQNLRDIRGIRFITRTQSWANNEVYNQIYVMDFKDYHNMKIVFNAITNDTYWNPKSNFIIILEPEVRLDKIINFFVLHNVYNVTILRKEENEHAIYTFQSPIPACNQSHLLVRITQCSAYNGGSYIFPTIIIESLRGCRFKLNAQNYYPMVNFDNDRSEGWEQQMMQIFGERYNILIELVQYSKIDSLGRIVGNYTFVDMLNQVITGKVEGAIGGYYVGVNALGKLSFGYPIVIDHMVLIIPKAEFYDTWSAVFRRSFNVIIFIVCLIIVFSILAYVLVLFPSRERDYIRDLTIVFGYFLNKTTVRDMKQGIPETLLISTLLFSVFIIPFSIQAYMCSVKTNPVRSYQAKDFREIQENYQLIVPQHWEKKELTQNSRSCIDRMDCLNLVMNYKDKGHYTMMSEMLYEVYIWMANDYSCSSHSYKVRDPVTALMRTVYFRHGSILVKPYNQFVLDFASSGLLWKQYDNLVYSKRLKCRFHAVPEQVALRLIDLKQPFTILFVGYCLSFIWFVFEVITKKR